MKPRNLLLAPLAVACAAFATGVQAQWSGSFSDMGVQYSLTDLGGTAAHHTFSLVLNTTGYNHAGSNPALAYLDSVDIKAWSGSDISFTLASAPNGVAAWTGAVSPISSGPVGNTGCTGSGGGFACAESNAKGVFSVLSGSSYRFDFSVTLNGGSFLTSFAGTHVGAGYANAGGSGNSYGITSYTATGLIPEPETYAMLLTGLGLLGYVARRRIRKETASA